MTFATKRGVILRVSMRILGWHTLRDVWLTMLDKFDSCSIKENFYTQDGRQARWQKLLMWNFSSNSIPVTMPAYILLFLSCIWEYISSYCFGTCIGLWTLWNAMYMNIGFTEACLAWEAIIRSGNEVGCFPSSVWISTCVWVYRSNTPASIPPKKKHSQNMKKPPNPALMTRTSS